MIAPSRQPISFPAALRRLSRLAALGDADRDALIAAFGDRRDVRAHREIVAEGSPIRETRLMASGWAARVRLLPDGRRQVLHVLLPGDLIGGCGQPEPLAMSAVVALTDVAWCVAPPIEAHPALAAAYAMSRACEMAYLLGHITRLGRLNAQERIGDLLLELLERADSAGLVEGNSFDMPLTQETLADAIGLTPVHVNRVLQQMRRDGDLHWKYRRVTIADPAALARKVGRIPMRISALG